MTVYVWGHKELKKAQAEGIKDIILVSRKTMHEDLKEIPGETMRNRELRLARTTIMERYSD